MQRAAVYELACCKPHEPDAAPMSIADYDIYAAGYRLALVKALEAMDHADARYRLYLRTRRLEARRKDAQ